MVVERVFVSVKNREIKAKKIEAILSDFLQSNVKNLKILDVGCGIGQIAEYFSYHNDVVGVDVQNRLEILDGSPLKFVQLTSDALPFDGESFDVVITNHVVEHVENQDGHLHEIHRVLKSGAICYLATPNWNFPIEPHYKIPFIHYLPHGVFHRVLRLLGKYKEDLFLLSHRNMITFFSAHGFEVTEYTGKVLKDPSRFHLGLTITRYIPAFLLDVVERISPTNIFILRKIA